MKSISLGKLLAIALLAGSIGVLARKEWGPPPLPARPAATTVSGTSVIAYYFHGKVRCATCDRIEAYAKEAVVAGFPAEVQAGRLQWRTVNYDAPGNEHFATDYQLVAPCVVLVTFRDGRQVAWQSLPEVWEHLGKKAVLMRCVRDAVRVSLAAQPHAEGEGGRKVP